MKLFPFILLSLSVLFSAYAKGQDFEVSPAALEFTIDPFETANRIVTITNHSNSTTLYKLDYSDYVMDIDGKVEMVAHKSTENSCMDWLLPDQDVVQLNPNESAQIKVTMQISEEDYKARWGYIFVQTSKEQTAFDADKNVPRTGLNLQGRIAIQVIRQPKTEQEPNITIKNLIELPEEEKAENEKNKQVFSVFIDNKGNAIYKCEVLVVASNLKNANEYEVFETQINAYPGFPRRIKFSLPEKLLENGEYSLVALLDYGKKNTMEGCRLNKTLMILEE